MSQLSRRRCPSWFDEGLAHVVQGGDAEASSGQLVASVLSDPARRGSLYRLSELIRSMTPTDGSERVGLAHAQAYLLVKLLVDRHGMSTATALLSDLAGGGGFDAAFRYRVGKSVAEFEREWLAGRASRPRSVLQQM